MSKPQVLLVLVHQGLSYLPVICEFAKELGVGVAAISSTPLEGAPIEDQRDLLADLRIADQQDLDWPAVQKAIIEWQANYQVVGAISTFEGYRILMAQANEVLSVNDCAPEQLRIALDKYQMRKTLLEVGLSQANTQLISESNFDQLKNQSAQFIKPRCGVGSFGCVKLTDDMQWRDVQKLVERVQADDFLKVAYHGLFDFVAEDFIAGTEFSFEVIAQAGEYHTLAIHEKVGLEERDNTVLENMDVSPPLTLSQSQQDSGTRFVNQVLSALALKEGAFHVEARWDAEQDHWEIIEVNPRIGGGFIDSSVKYVTGNYSILEFWMMVLLRGIHQNQSKLTDALKVAKSPSQPKATLGNYCFGVPGKIINAIIERDPGVESVERHDILQVGDKLPDLNREIPIREALWVVDVDQLDALLKKMNRGWVDVEYV